MSEKIRIARDDIPGTIEALLESNFWLHDLKTGKHYRRLHDDDDGTKQGEIVVMFADDGDVCVFVSNEDGSLSDILRFRMPGLGGGRSHRVRNALLILAVAVKLDEEKNPIPK